MVRQSCGVRFERLLSAIAALLTAIVPSIPAAHAQSGSLIETISYHDNEGRWILGQVESVTTNGVTSEQTTFDPVSALPLQMRQFGKLTQSLSYNLDGTVASTKDGNGNATVYSAWKFGIPQSIAYADGTASSAIVDLRGLITQVTDRNGYATSYSYDNMGRLTGVQYPIDDTVAWNSISKSFAQIAAAEYGIPAGHWRQTATVGASTTNTYYDAMWRPLLIAEYDTGNIAGTARFRGFEYDHDGREVFASYPTSTSNPDKGVWTSYDALGRQVSQSQDSEQGLLTTTMSYLGDAAGSLTLLRNPRGGETRTWHQVFDEPSYNRPIRIAEPEGVVTTIARDAFGKPSSIIRANTDGSIQVARNYTYNSFHELCRSVEPETNATLMGYDGAGNLRWSAAGLPAATGCEGEGVSAVVAARRIDRTYDNRNRLRTIAFPDGKGNQGWTYTADGKVSRIVTQNGSTAAEVTNTYVYNKRRLLTGESIEQIGLPTLSMGYSYDANAAVAGVRYPSGLFVDYAPNALGQPTRVGTYAIGVSYHPNGGVSSFTYGNGIIHSMQQNGRQLPVRVVDGSVLDNSYSYDANANVTQITDGLAASRSRTLTYDGRDRLIKAVSPAFGGNGEQSYSYDALDNLRSSTLPGIKDHTYWYDASNRLTNVLNSGAGTVIGMSYDAQGNLANRNGQAYLFDFGNRLRDASGAESYRYDGWGRRLLQQAGTGTIVSMYSRDGVLRRRDNERNASSLEYIYLNSSLIALVATSTAPLPPGITVPSQSSNGSYVVSWTSVASANRYELQEQTGGGAWSNIYSGPALSSSLSNKSGGTYSYRARACRNTPCGNWSTVASVAVLSAPASGPVISAPSLSINGDYTVSWNPIAAATAYRLEESTNGGAWSEVQSSAVTSRSFSGRPDGSYAYRVRACNAAGCGVTSATATVQTLRIPSGISTLSAPALSTNGSYGVSWSAVSSATTYRLEESAGGAAWALVHNAAANSISFAQRPDGSYAYRVTACNSSGCGGASATAVVRVVRPPSSAPTISAPSISSDGNFTVSWSATGGATIYRLSESSNGTAWSEIQASSSTAMLRSGKADGTHSYRLVACNDGGCGPQSAQANVLVVRPPLAVALSAPGQSTNGAYTVTWNGAERASNYVLEESTNGGGWVAIQNSSATALAISGKADGSYAYRVAACNQGGCSGYSAVATVSVVIAPAVPTGLTARFVVVSPSPPWQARYFLSWNPVAGATSYEVSGRVNYSGTATSVQLNYTGSPQGASFVVRACRSGACSAWSAPVVANGG